MGELIAEMRALDGDLAAESEPALTALEPHLHEGISALATASESLLAIYRARPERALAGAVPYLQLFGTVTAGWLMTKAALAAWRGCAANPAQREFCDGKLVAARFFAEHRLATAPGLLPAIAGGETVMKLDAEKL